MGLLAEWMDRTGETDQTLAPKVGVSRVHVSRLRRLIHNPSPDLAKKLEEVTAIPAANFIFEDRAT
jgi:transcriptional regulator with XRE-family HTH domain